MARETLISICERASVPQKWWFDRDSAMAQRQVGECLMLLKAGCDFEVMTAPDDTNGMVTDANTIWVKTWAQGFQYFENHDPGDDPHAWCDEHTYYLPTEARLKKAAGKDWY